MYLRSKFKLLEKALVHLDALEPLFEKFNQEQMEKLDKSLAGGEDFSDLADNWVGTKNKDIIRSYPPQLIVSK
jgi:hypothetical protein